MLIAYQSWYFTNGDNKFKGDAKLKGTDPFNPIELVGGLNFYAYAPNSIEWTDPLGLSKTHGSAGAQNRSNKLNQNAKCPCRKKWEITRYDRICEAKLNGTVVKYYRAPGTEIWWSADTEGRGGTAWKMMEQESNNLVHVQDANIYGDYMNKRKGETGRVMPMKGMKCQDAKGVGS